jgi:hypothetical protein
MRLGLSVSVYRGQTVTTGKDRRRIKLIGSVRANILTNAPARGAASNLHRRSCAWAMPRRKHVFVSFTKTCGHIGIVAHDFHWDGNTRNLQRALIFGKDRERNNKPETQPRQTRSALKRAGQASERDEECHRVSFGGPADRLTDGMGSYIATQMMMQAGET